MSKTKHAPDHTDFRNFHVPDINVDMNDPDSYSLKVLPERETRRRMLTHARMKGCEKEMLLVFAKFDKLMRTCKNDSERKDMAKLACIEVYSLLGKGGELVVDGVVVYK